jgi:hypothetical protein
LIYGSELNGPLAQKQSRGPGIGLLLAKTSLIEINMKNIKKNIRMKKLYSHSTNFK